MEDIAKSKSPEKKPERIMRKFAISDDDPGIKEINDPRRIMSIGEELIPFDEEKSFLKPSGFSHSFIAPIGLKIEERVFPIRITTVPYNLSRDHSLTPLDPELGYGISAEDFELKSREQKLRSQPELLEPQGRLDTSKLYSDTFAHLVIEGVSSILNKSKLNQELSHNSYKFPKETLELLRRLRAVVNVSTEAFEGKPSELYLSGGEIRFEKFYPQKTGPIAVLKRTYEETIEADMHQSIEEASLQYTLTMEGLFLAFPNELEKLKQIKLKFVLVDEGGEKIWILRK